MLAEKEGSEKVLRDEVQGLTEELRGKEEELRVQLAQVGQLQTVAASTSEPGSDGVVPPVQTEVKSFFRLFLSNKQALMYLGLISLIGSY